MDANVVSPSARHARKRAIAKTLGYRFFMVVITIAVAWVVVGDAADAMNIGIVANILKTGTYYLYERAWNHITWGVIAPE